jgi:hypothetical protein
MLQVGSTGIVEEEEEEEEEEDMYECRIFTEDQICFLL